MTARRIAVALWRELEFRRSHRPVVPNAYIDGWFECDVASVTKAGYWWEFEIKISRADFKNDALKEQSFGRGRAPENKHELLKTSGRGPSRFCYVTPEGLLKPEEIPEFAGLWEVTSRNRIREVKRPPARHSEKIADGVVRGMFEKMYWRYWRLAEKWQTTTHQKTDGSD